MSPNRMSAIIQPFLNVMLILFIIGLFITWLQSDDEDDEFSVTITYDCVKVLTERDYPTEVLKECLELRDELNKRK